MHITDNLSAMTCTICGAAQIVYVPKHDHWRCPNCKSKFNRSLVEALHQPTNENTPVT